MCTSGACCPPGPWVRDPRAAASRLRRAALRHWLGPPALRCPGSWSCGRSAACGSEEKGRRVLVLGPGVEAVWVCLPHTHRQTHIYTLVQTQLHTSHRHIYAYTCTLIHTCPCPQVSLTGVASQFLQLGSALTRPFCVISSHPVLTTASF